MRSRPDLELRLPQRICPGDRVPLELTLRSRSVTPVDHLTLRLEGTETMIGSSGNRGAQYIERFLSLGCELAHGVTLGERSHVYTSEFTLPPTARFTYAGPHLTIAYRLTAHVDIPWWPDARETYTIVVQPASQARPPRAPAIHTTAQGGEPFLEVHLDDTAFAPGDVVRGAVAAGNLDGGALRGVDFAFVAIEKTLHGYFSSTREAARYTASLPPGDVGLGQALPFSIELPKGVHATFTGSLGWLAWHFEVRLVRAWKPDLVHSIPILVAPFDRPAVGSAWAPRVGETRWREVYRVVGERHGLALDADALELRGSIAGVTIRVHPEHEGSRLEFVAQLGWEPWGIAIGIEPRKLPFGGIELPDDTEGFGGRYRVRGREAAQARAALAPTLRQAILALDEVRLTDDHATARRAAQNHDDVARFMDTIAWLARELAAVAERVPPPSAMVLALPAWRALAEELGGRLAQGGMRLDGAFEGSRIGIATRFEGGPEPKGTIVTLHLDPPLDRELDPTKAEELAALPAAARELVTHLTGEARRLEIRPEGMRLEVEGGVEDPATLLPLAASMLALARRLRGDLRAGPYR